MHLDTIKIGILGISDSSRAENMLNIAEIAVKQTLNDFDAMIVERKVVSCEGEEIEWELRRLCEYVHVDLVLTLGAMEIGPRDITPDCTLNIIEWRLEGIETAMRLALIDHWPQSMLSRAVCGIYNRTLVINLPEDTEQIRKCLQTLTPILPLAIYSIKSHPAENE